MHKRKPSKAEIVAALCRHVDIDPDDTFPYPAERERLAKLARALADMQDHAAERDHQFWQRPAGALGGLSGAAGARDGETRRAGKSGGRGRARCDRHARCLSPAAPPRDHQLPE